MFRPRCYRQFSPYEVPPPPLLQEICDVKFGDMPVPAIPVVPLTRQAWKLIGSVERVKDGSVKEAIKECDSKYDLMYLLSSPTINGVFEYCARTEDGEMIYIEGHCDLENGDVIKNVGHIHFKYKVKLYPRYRN